MSIYIVDYTARSLPYDKLLCENLYRINADIKLLTHVKAWNQESKRYITNGPFTGKPHSGGNSNFVKLIKALKYFFTILFFVPIWLLKSDLIHFQWLPLIKFGKFEYHLFKILNLFGVKIIYTVHNVLPHDTGLKYYDVFKKVYKKSDRLICHTDTAKKKLVNDFGIKEQKITVIPHGPLELDCEKNDLKPESSKEYIVLLFGILKPYKGCGVLLEAIELGFKKFHKKDIKFKLAGYPPPEYEKELRAGIEKKGITSLIDFKFRYLEESELCRELEKSDLIVFPYKEITQSGALLTAITFDTPIIASRLNPFEEYFNEDVIYFIDRENPKQLAEGIIDLHSDKKKYSSYVAAIESFNDTNSWNRIASKTDNLYKEMRN